MSSTWRASQLVTFFSSLFYGRNFTYISLDLLSVLLQWTCQQAVRQQFSTFQQQITSEYSILHIRAKKISVCWESRAYKVTLISHLKWSFSTTKRERETWSCRLGFSVLVTSTIMDYHIAWEWIRRRISYEIRARVSRVSNLFTTCKLRSRARMNQIPTRFFFLNHFYVFISFTKKQKINIEVFDVCGGQFHLAYMWVLRAHINVSESQIRH